ASLGQRAAACLCVPAFYRHDVTPISEFLRARVGRASQVTGSVFGFVARLLGSSVRLMAAAFAVAILMAWPVGPTIALFTVISIVYIGAGGVNAVGSTHAFQSLVFLVARAVTVGYLVR